MKPLVVLPSYNEKDNIVQLMESILAHVPNVFICVVDDSSPDGTSDLIKDAINTKPGWNERTMLIVRSKKDGRGGAVRDGFAWGFNSSHDFDAFAEMDCDFSHEPQAIQTGLKHLENGSDVSLGSRYPDGTIINWPLSRRIFSFFANTLARTLLSWKIHDYTNGFRFYNRDAVSLLLNHPQKHKGYIYLSETLSLFLLHGKKITTFPTIFKNRIRGKSNTTFKEIRSALFGLVSICWNHSLKKRHG